MHAKPALYCQVAARAFEPEGGAGGNNSVHERLVWLPRAQGQGEDALLVRGDDSVPERLIWLPCAQGQGEDASLVSTLSRDSEGVSLNSLQTGASGETGSMPSMIAHNDWEIAPMDIEIMRREDGSPWELGAGAFGKVRARKRADGALRP